jgi:hypothetical protein
LRRKAFGRFAAAFTFNDHGCTEAGRQQLFQNLFADLLCLFKNDGKEANGKHSIKLAFLWLQMPFNCTKKPLSAA